MAARPKVLIPGSPVPGHRPEREILEPLAEIVTAKVDAGAERAAVVRDVDAELATKAARNVSEVLRGRPPVYPVNRIEP